MEPRTKFKFLLMYQRSTLSNGNKSEKEQKKSRIPPPMIFHPFQRRRDRRTEEETLITIIFVIIILELFVVECNQRIFLNCEGLIKNQIAPIDAK